MAKSGTGSRKEPVASRPRGGPPPPRPAMPRWLKYTLAGLILFTLTLWTGPMIPPLVCASALGLGVWQLWQRRARMWWTGAMFLAVGLYVLGMFLTRWHASLSLFFFVAWILVIVTLVAESGRLLEHRKAPRTG